MKTIFFVATPFCNASLAFDFLIFLLSFRDHEEYCLPLFTILLSQQEFRFRQAIFVHVGILYIGFLFEPVF